MNDKQTANLSIQKANRTGIYTLFRRERELTRQDIVRELHLSLPTVIQNISELQQEGLVQEDGFVGHTGGRKARTYSMVKNARTAIGLDITRNRIAVVLVDLSGKVISEKNEQCKFERTESYFRRIGQHIEEVVKKYGEDGEMILGAGIGLPCLITPDNQTVTFGEFLKCTGAACGEFAEFIRYPAALYNDASAAGFAEFWIRRKQENPVRFGKNGFPDISTFYLMLSSNIGGSIMINNRIHQGIHYRSGGIGHLTLHPKGKPCYCGQRGCVDAYLATSILASHANDSLPEFFRLLESGNKTVSNAWNTYLDDLALTVNNLAALFDCTIILGGYLGKFLDRHIDELKERAARLNFIEKNGDYLETGLYKTNSIAAGAALNLIAGFIDSI